MKRVFLFIELLVMAVAANATGQESDIIYIDGTRWELLGRPICADSVLYSDLINALPQQRSISTANWDGFTAYWSIERDVLLLDSIRCEHYDLTTKTVVGEQIPVDTLFRVFKKYVAGKRIVAGWLSGNIRVASGKVIYYQHMGFERNYEEEQIISISKGRVSGKQEYHNYVTDGFSFDKVRDKAELREMFPISFEQFPELANTNRIMFSIKQARIDSQGNLVECEVKVLKPADNPRLANEMTRLLKAYHPWRVLFINGEYRTYGIAHWTFPYLLDK